MGGGSVPGVGGRRDSWGMLPLQEGPLPCALDPTPPPGHLSDPPRGGLAFAPPPRRSL